MESYYVDIHLAFEVYKYEFNSNKDLYNYILKKYYNSFKLRKDISLEELLNLIESSCEDEIDQITKRYKIPYIFGYRKDELDDEYKVIHILQDSTRPDFWNCESDRYLTVYEGVEVLDECLSGVLFKPTKLLGYYKTQELDDSKFYYIVYIRKNFNNKKVGIIPSYISPTSLISSFGISISISL